jgi:hypothetical protein
LLKGLEFGTSVLGDMNNAPRIAARTSVVKFVPHDPSACAVPGGRPKGRPPANVGRLSPGVDCAQRRVAGHVNLRVQVPRLALSLSVAARRAPPGHRGRRETALR